MTMQVFVPKELDQAETRVPVVPETVQKLVALGILVNVQAGLGATLHIADDRYQQAGARIAADRIAALAEADLILRLQPPPLPEVAYLRQGAIHLSYLEPAQNFDLVTALAAAGVTALSMEMMPRTTVAQKLDALSSQASLAGYEAVIVAAARLRKIFPMMMTPAGTLVPARVFVIGAGVAGLQAIATAKRLGARVDAFDTRPAVKEQVQSLGARFVEVDLGETGQEASGYAKTLNDAQLAKQREAMTRHCAAADVVITTAQIFGKPAPRIVTEPMIAAMKPGSVIVDLAIESGGNVAGARLDAEVEINGVTIMGLAHLARRAARDASLMYASNLASFVEHFWDSQRGAFSLPPDDEIIRGCLITHQGEVVHPLVKQWLKQARG